MRANGSCSTLLHSSPDTLSPALPKPQAVQNETAALRNWVANIRQRQDNIDLLLIIQSDWLDRRPRTRRNYRR